MFVFWVYNVYNPLDVSLQNVFLFPVSGQDFAICCPTNDNWPRLDVQQDIDIFVQQMFVVTLTWGRYPPPPWNQHSTWKWMVGIVVSFWDGLFSGAMLVSGSVISCYSCCSFSNFFFQPFSSPKLQKVHTNWPFAKRIVVVQLLFLQRLC